MTSTLLDRGRELILVWPQVEVTTPRGDTKKIPSDTPVPIRCTTSEDRSQIADLPGQIDVHILRVVARRIPVAEDGTPPTWARIMYQGQEYDMSEPPRKAMGPSRAIEHWEFKLRSRANLAPIGTAEQRAATVRGPDQFGPVGGEPRGSH